MKILVTGGNGFIGRHMIAELVSRKVEVISYDIVPPVDRLKGVQYVIGTTLDEFNLAQSMRDCDGVFHLAAILGVKRADAQLLKCMTVNIEGTLAVLRAAVLTGVKRVLLSSSSEIFGDISQEKIKETSPLNPKSGYAISKLAAEEYARGFAREYGIDFTIVRYFNIYGPGQVAEFVVPRFIKMALNGIAPTIYGDGKQSRSFCHIGDAARATVDVFSNADSANEHFNIGNDDEPCTVTNLAEKISELTGNRLTPVYVPFSRSDRNSSREIYYRAPNISKVNALTGYKPKISLDAGLRNVIESGDIPESWVEPIDGFNND